MNEQINTMDKDEVIRSIEKTISMFRESMEGTILLFSEDSESFQNEEDALLKKHLKSLVERLAAIKKEDLKTYDSIIKEVNDIKPFAERVQELSEVKKIVSKSVISVDTDTNSRQLADIMKSSEVFDFINRDKKEITNEDFKVFGDFAPYMQILWKQVKQEELLGLLIYVNSGKAAKDFKKLEELNFQTDSVRADFLYTEFKRAFLDLSILRGQINVTEKLGSENKVAPSKHLDYGVIINSESKELHFGFATSNFNTESQQKQFFKMMKDLKNEVALESSPYFGYKLKPIYITNSIINENELKFNQTEKQKPFLKTFEEELSKKDRNTLNKSSLLAMFNNVQDTDVLSGLLITDLIKANPYIAGADTLPLYDKFQGLSKLESREQAIELRNFLLFSSEELLGVLKKGKVINLEETSNMHHVHGMIWNNLGRMLLAAKNNFVGFLDKEDFLDDQFAHKLGQLIKDVKITYLDKFMGANPNNTVNFKELFYGARDIKGNMEAVYEDYLHAETARINDRNQASLFSKTNYIMEATNAFKKVMPILESMKVYSEDEILGLRDRTAALYEAVKTNPALQSMKDVLNSSSFSELREWGKSYEKFYLSDSPYNKVTTKREVVRNILENIHDLNNLVESLELYGKDYIAEKSQGLAKSIKKL